MTRIRTGFAAWGVMCLLAPGLPAHAQSKIAQLLPLQPQQREKSAQGVVHDSLFAAAAAPAANAANEIVLHQFQSAPHGAYPNSGVILDGQGNLYGTTNGSYSDIGGGGTNDAGVVFKIDRGGHQTVLYSFKGGTDGSTPNGLVRDGVGNLYGTTSGGGASGAGTVFRVDPAGNEAVLYSFTGGNDGGTPSSVVRDAAGNLYGVTAGGGASGAGTVFRLDAAGNETVLYSFTGGADGAIPSPGIALDAAGSVYGATAYGGAAASAGVVFKVDAGGHETVLYTFTGGTDGGQPNGVARDPKGNLYGTTSDGGNAPQTSGSGVVFKIDPTGHETVLYTFTGGNDGGSSYAGVSLDHAGNVFGTTDIGGPANAGVVFKVDASGHETVLHAFARGPYGDQPNQGGVTLDEDCALYGTTSFSGSGGQGAVYKLDRDGNISVVYAFPGNEGGQYSYNASLLLDRDGQLYGTTEYGGEHGVGVVYGLDPRSGEQTVHYTFSIFTTTGYGQPTAGVARDAAGNFFGTTFIGQAQAGFGFGVVFEVDAAGNARVLHNFTGGADGGNPYGGVILDGKGTLYGTAVGGGASNFGVVFSVDQGGHESVLYSFTGGADGGAPLSGLIRDSAGNLYGTTEVGGSGGAGVVFKLSPTGQETALYSFSGGADGGYPLGGLVRDAAGNLYGATGGGAAGAGVVYKVDTSGNETVLYTFTGGADGGYPAWGALARDSQGNLFGTASGGGADNQGVVFKVDPTGNETVLHSFTGKEDGGSPASSVILGPAGHLYGVTALGGTANVGVVYEITP